MSRTPNPADKSKWATERKKAKRQQQRETRDAKRKAAILREARKGIPGEILVGRTKCPYCAETFYFRLRRWGPADHDGVFRRPLPPNKCPFCGHEITVQ